MKWDHNLGIHKDYFLFLGDFSREEDRHLMSAEIPSVKPDVLIGKSTIQDVSHRIKDSFPQTVK